MFSKMTREFLISILEAIPQGIMIMSPTKEVLYVNKMVTELAGIGQLPDGNYSRLGPETWTQEYGLFHENGADQYDPSELPVIAALRGKYVNDEIVILRRKGIPDKVLSISARPARDVSGNIIGSVAAFIDKTEYINVRNQLEHARRSESIGRLVGGIAHDFNNMLNTVLLAANNAIEQLDIDNPAYDDLKLILDVSERSAALTKQLLAFGRRQVIQPKIVDLSELIKKNLEMLKRLVGENVTIKLIQGPTTVSASVDPTMLEQIMLNLCVNARDAMPKGGTITIETDIVELDEKYVSQHSQVKTGRYAALVVTDDGQGISKEYLDKIFDPFFTTKKDGTGLGLATVQGIVEQSNAHIWVYSEVGSGTTFKIYFPYVPVTISEKQANSLKADSRGGDETILVVEDDPYLRLIVEKILRSRGYNVLIADGGPRALQLAESAKGPIDLLVTDVIMPGMNGKELAETLARKFANLKIIFTSGYSENIIVNHGILDAGVNYLQKPVSENILLQKIRMVLT